MSSIIRSKPLMDGAKDQPCIRCGNQDGTVVRAHYCGVYQHRFGKGTGHKGHDLIGAYLCAECHRAMDQYIFRDPTREADFLAFCFLTVLIDIREGRINVKGWTP